MKNKMTKSKLGFLLGLIPIVNLFALIKLKKFNDKDDRVDYTFGWLRGFLIITVLIGVVIFVYTCWTNAWQLIK